MPAGLESRLNCAKLQSIFDYKIRLLRNFGLYVLDNGLDLLQDCLRTAMEPDAAIRRYSSDFHRFPVPLAISTSPFC